MARAKFILAGTFIDNSNLVHPKIFIGDMKKKMLFAYIDNLSVATKNGYTSVKLKKLNIQHKEHLPPTNPFQFSEY